LCVNFGASGSFSGMSSSGFSSPIAFPIPVDAATAAWATPVFVLLALTGFAVLVWQTVRYFRNNRDE
ncbi:MAG: hypothetical protein LH471_02105, partial [Salinibacterium sp.]|nr:hypothetical protein [Salinibacterium sp.]